MYENETQDMVLDSEIFYSDNAKSNNFKTPTPHIKRYENGCLTPDMGSVFIALDPSVKANGCLQVSIDLDCFVSVCLSVLLPVCMSVVFCQS